MSTGAASRRAGARYETDLVKFFRELGYDTERLRLSGKQDEGDLVVRVDGERFIIEAKAGKNVRPRFWFDEEAVPEADNYTKRRDLPHRAIPVLSMKSHNKAIGKSLVTISLEDFAYLLQRAEGSNV